MWWQSFYDADYLPLWGPFYDEAASAAQADAIITVLELAAGARVLDAPCGFGRLSRPLAARGMTVTGVDQADALIADAEQKGGGPTYLRHDLRERLPAGLGPFDAAIDVFSSIGHGTEDDDRAVFATLAAVLAPGGRLMVETMHRDVLVARRAANNVMHSRTNPDGTKLVEEATWDPIRGRVDSVWTWSGPRGNGEKRSSLRLYAIPELVALLAGAGLAFERAFVGCTITPFTGEGPTAGGRIALIARKSL